MHIFRLLSLPDKPFCICYSILFRYPLILKLLRYETDPVVHMIELNEDLLWKIYIFYSFNAAALRKQDGTNPPLRSFVKLKPAPVFHSAAKYEKRLLHQDDLWKMMKDFDFVPTIVNTIRFNKLMGDLGQRRSDHDKTKIRLNFREFIKVIVSISKVSYQHQKPARRIVRLLAYMEKSGNLQRMRDTGRVEGDTAESTAVMSFRIDEVGTEITNSNKYSAIPLSVLRFGGTNNDDVENEEAKADEDDVTKKATQQKAIYELLLQRAADDQLQQKLLKQQAEVEEEDMRNSLPFGGESKTYDMAMQHLHDKERLEEELRLAHETMESLTVELSRTQGELRLSRAEIERYIGEAIHVTDIQQRQGNKDHVEKQRLEETLRLTRAEADKSTAQMERIVNACKDEIDVVKKAALAEAANHELAKRDWARKLADLEDQLTQQYRTQDRISNDKNAELEKVIQSMTLLLQDARENNSLSQQLFAGKDKDIQSLQISLQEIRAKQDAEAIESNRLKNALAECQTQLQQAIERGQTGSKHILDLATALEGAKHQLNERTEEKEAMVRAQHEKMAVSQRQLQVI